MIRARVLTNEMSQNVGSRPMVEFCRTRGKVYELQAFEKMVEARCLFDGRDYPLTFVDRVSGRLGPGL